MVGSKINHSAIEAYAKAFGAKVTSLHFASNDTINGQQLLKVSPVKQVNYLILKNLFESWQEESKKLQSPYFNYKNDQVVKALVTFMNVLSQNIEIKRNDFETLLVTATQDCLYLMFAPFDYFWAELSQDNQSMVTIKSIKSKAKYFKFNKNIIDQYAVKLEGQFDQAAPPDKAMQVFEDMIKAGEFEADDPQTLIDEFSEILTLPMDELFESNEEIDPITSMLSDEDDLVLQFDDPVSNEETTPSKIENDLTKQEDSHSEPRNWFEEQEETTHQVEYAKETSEDDEEQAVDLSTVAPAENEKTSPLKRREVEDEETDVQGVLNNKFAREQKTLHDQLQGEEKVTIADVHHLSKTSKMQESISVNQRYMFINELFSGNSEAYFKAIDEIERCESFDDSVELMVQRFAKKLDWNMNSPEVKELLKVIFKRFR